MMRICRGWGVAPVLLVSLCITTTGCLSMGRDFTPGPNAAIGYPSPQPNNVAFNPGGGAAIQRTNYMPNGTLGVAPAGGGMMDPRVRFAGGPMKPDDAVIETAPNGVMPGAPVIGAGPVQPGLPTEKAMVSHPPHRVAPPDILFIEALRLVPRGPYRLAPMEVLQIDVADTLPKQEIKGLYMISPDGRINLGHSYGSIGVGGLTVEQAQVAIRNHLSLQIKNANVNVALVQMRGMQNVRGEHLVRPDGTISLGMYGSVYVAGMNLGQVKCTIENHLAAYLVDPQISVDVIAYNSRKIYIIADGAGYGQQVIAIPATGGETVLDAISRVQGLPAVASLKKIWVARPSPAGHPCSQVLPVDWKAITQAGRTETNYELFPGDRIYIHSNALITAYNYIDMALAPVERVLGVLYLGASTFQTFRGNTIGNTPVFIP